MTSLLSQLAKQTPGGYHHGGPLAAEPTAWAALALHRAGRNDDADRAAQWLCTLQRSDGVVEVTPDSTTPGWVTSLAMMAWQEIDPKKYSENIERAAAWTLVAKGTTSPRRPDIGHDCTLTGWSWAPNTHSWLEPTAFAVMALTTTGHANHPRTTEAVKILVDRLMPGGGCNYGNTKVLGQPLLPHIQPTGIVLWALAGHSTSDPRIARSCEYLRRELDSPTGCASLAYALIGLAAWDRTPANAQSLIAEALARPQTEKSTYKLALLALAKQHTLLVYPEPKATAVETPPAPAASG